MAAAAMPGVRTPRLAAHPPERAVTPLYTWRMASPRALPLVTFAPATAAAFWSRLQRDDEDACWVWPGAPDTSGYGRVMLDGLSCQAHRVALAIATGVDPWPALVLHSCDHPPCCNPRHLRAGTDADNTADRVARGRGHVNPKGRNGEAANRVVAFRLPADLADLLDDLAASERTSVSALLRDMVERRVCA